MKMDAEPRERNALKKVVHVWYCCAVCAEGLDGVGEWGYRCFDKNGDVATTSKFQGLARVSRGSPATTELRSMLRHVSRRAEQEGTKLEVESYIDAMLDDRMRVGQDWLSELVPGVNLFYHCAKQKGGCGIIPFKHGEWACFSREVDQGKDKGSEADDGMIWVCAVCGKIYHQMQDYQLFVIEVDGDQLWCAYIGPEVTELEKNVFRAMKAGYLKKEVDGLGPSTNEKHPYSAADSVLSGQ